MNYNVIMKHFRSIGANGKCKCRFKLTYSIPSMFYVRLEKEWVKWKESGSKLSFYDFCKSQLNVA